MMIGILVIFNFAQYLLLLLREGKYQFIEKGIHQFINQLFWWNQIKLFNNEIPLKSTAIDL